MTTVAEIQTKVNQYFRDSSTNSVSAANRLAAISEAVQQLMTEYGFDQSNLSYEFDYLDGVHYYDITTVTPYMLDPVDLKREVGLQSGLQDRYFSRKTAREIEIEIDTQDGERSFSIENVDGKTWLIINYSPKYRKLNVEPFNALNGDGLWVADTVNSDATNVTLDSNEFKEGNASLNFDIDVSQSGNDLATVYNSTRKASDFTNYENLASWLMWFYIPDSTDITSISIKWGSSTSAYWLNTTTTDIGGNALADGWNRLRIDWESSSMVGSPDVSDITYIAISVNYAGTQVDDTDFRVDELILSRPETLELTYNSWKIGRSNVGADLTAFTATTDIPFYSGQFDFFNNYVAHKAASILFRSVGLPNDALAEDGDAEKEKLNLKKRFPDTSLEKTRSFKVSGIHRRTNRRIWHS